MPLAAKAQPAPDRPLIGILSPQSAATWAPNLEALRTGLRDLGYIEGRNIWLEFRYADGNLERLPALAAELVARKPDIIVAGSTPGTVAVHRATQSIPIVMVTLSDPVALGVVKSIARPGGNVTGIYMFGGNDALLGKRIDLLKEVVPGLSRMGVIVASGDQSDAIVQRLLPAATRALGMAYKVFEVRTNAELDAAFAQAASDNLQGLFVSQNPFLLAHQEIEWMNLMGNAA